MISRKINNNKKYYFILLLFCIILGVSLYILISHPNIIPNSWREQFLSHCPFDLTNIRKTTSSQKVLDEIKPVEVKLIVGDKKYETTTLSNQTVFDLMNRLVKNNSFSFKTKEFKGAGSFVEEINNIKNDANKKMYWMFYVNGKTAEVGIDQQIVKENDVIEWKYEKSIY